ncbi:hypothetical protein ACFV2Z_10715 [Streptomyces sp. NPDC059688]|uniref:hypothetical protein n=1 Tax=Streptomyces sp. NPDC059688 TaxID=3346906 RepID=UPI00369B8B64
MTEHSVVSGGRPLLVKGHAGLDLGPGERFEGRLRTPGTDDVVVTAYADVPASTAQPPRARPPSRATRPYGFLLLWGRRPADPSRRHSSAGPDTPRKVRGLPPQRLLSRRPHGPRSHRRASLYRAEVMMNPLRGAVGMRPRGIRRSWSGTS